MPTHLRVNRAPVLTLWAAVVAERLGFEPGGGAYPRTRPGRAYSPRERCAARHLRAGLA